MHARAVSPNFAQGSKARPEFLAHGVVGGVVEARVLPEGVGLGQNVALRSAQPAERGEMLVSKPAGGERSGRASRLNCGLKRERGTVLTSTTSLTSASASSVVNSSIGRVECPMVKSRFAIRPLGLLACRAA